MNATLPKNQITENSLKSLTKSSVLAWAVTTGSYQVFPFLLSFKPCPLIIAILISIINYFSIGKHQLHSFLLAIFNGFLIYISALGISGALGSVLKTTTETSAKNLIENNIDYKTEFKRPAILQYWYEKPIPVHEQADKKIDQ